MENTVTVRTEDVNTIETLKIIEERISKMERIQETPYKTTGNLNGFNSIKTETSIENLIRAHSYITNKEKKYYKSADILGVKKAPQFTEGGGTAADWEADIKLRIQIIDQEDMLKRLTKYKEEMSKFLSDQDRKAMLMSEMADLFSGDSGFTTLTAGNSSSAEETEAVEVK